MAELTNTAGATSTRLGEFLNSEGNVNYDAVRSRVQQAAQQTRTVAGAQEAMDVASTRPKTQVGRAVSDTLRSMRPSGGSKSSTQSARYAEALAGQQKLGQDVAQTQQQAAKAASALEMMGDVTTAYLKRLEGLKQTVVSTQAKASDLWKEAVEKADEFVMSARTRVAQVMGQFEQTVAKISTDMGFEKAHDMQVAAQGVLGAMKAEEKGILENYGPDSAEYQQFKLTKARSLALAQSDIHAKYGQLWAGLKNTVIGATASLAEKLNMYTSFQEQQAVDKRAARAQYSATYDLQVGEFLFGVENAMAAGFENLGNWMLQTPSYAVDMGPFLAQLSELAEANRAEKPAVTMSYGRGIYG